MVETGTVFTNPSSPLYTGDAGAGGGSGSIWGAPSTSTPYSTQTTPTSSSSASTTPPPPVTTPAEQAATPTTEEERRREEAARASPPAPQLSPAATTVAATAPTTVVGPPERPVGALPAAPAPSIVYANQGAIRSQPVSDRLAGVLVTAGQRAGVSEVRIFSGGQPASGPNRTGSHRHDLGNAADLQLVQNGRALNFDDPADRPVFERFITAAVGAGAEGVGAGDAYMGAASIHVGFGTSAAWGSGGHVANAPAWLTAAHQAGLANPISAAAYLPTAGATPAAQAAAAQASGAPAPAGVPIPLGMPPTGALSAAVIDQRALLGRGSAGPAVAELQGFLNAEGVTDARGRPLKEDGVFGIRTGQAVRSYQRRSEIAVDGRVGPETLQAVLYDVAPYAVTMPGAAAYRLGAGAAARIIDPTRADQVDLPLPRPRPAGAGAAPPPGIPSKADIGDYVVEAARARGIDPDVALAVARAEGLNALTSAADGYRSKIPGEQSYGPYQLHLGGGALGDAFMADTGLDPRDPATAFAQVDYALDHAAKSGWGAFRGAADNGIAARAGLENAKALGRPTRQPTVAGPPERPIGDLRPAGGEAAPLHEQQDKLYRPGPGLALTPAEEGFYAKPEPARPVGGTVVAGPPERPVGDLRPAGGEAAPADPIAAAVDREVAAFRQRLSEQGVNPETVDWLADAHGSALRTRLEALPEARAGADPAALDAAVRREAARYQQQTMAAELKALQELRRRSEETAALAARRRLDGGVTAGSVLNLGPLGNDPILIRAAEAAREYARGVGDAYRAVIDRTRAQADAAALAPAAGPLRDEVITALAGTTAGDPAAVTTRVFDFAPRLRPARDAGVVVPEPPANPRRPGA